MDVSEDPLQRFFRELDRVKDDQRLLVIVSHGFLELLVNALIDAECRNSKRITSNNRDYPHSAKLLILNEKAVIDDGFYKTLDWLRKLRNRAAHDPFFELTKSDLSLFGTTYGDPENFYGLCVMLLTSFWNTHVHVFVPIFSPSIHKPSQDL